MTDEETPLVGGNMGPVRRRGQAVHRPSGPWTPLVHRLMHGLREAGLSFVPQPLGLSSDGAEVVEYAAGDVGTYPMPTWVWDDKLLEQVARQLRLVHDASSRLDLPLDGWRRSAGMPAEVICHGDIAPYNTVFRDGQVVAFIDWDYSMPAPRGWDLGYAAYRWVSLTPSDHPDGRRQNDAERDRRLALFCDAYGGVSTEAVLSWAVRRLDDLVTYSRERVVAGDPAYIATTEAGHVDLYAADADWLRQHYGIGE